MATESKIRNARYGPRIDGETENIFNRFFKHNFSNFILAVFSSFDSRKPLFVPTSLYWFGLYHLLSSGRCSCFLISVWYHFISGYQQMDQNLFSLIQDPFDGISLHCVHVKHTPYWFLIGLILIRFCCCCCLFYHFWSIQIHTTHSNVTVRLTFVRIPMAINETFCIWLFSLK